MNTRVLVTIAFLLIAAPQVPSVRRLYIRRYACSIVASNGSRPAAKYRNGGTCAPRCATARMRLEDLESPRQAACGVGQVAHALRSGHAGRESYFGRSPTSSWRAVFVPFGGRNSRQHAAIRSINQQLATRRGESVEATGSITRHHPATGSNSPETTLLTGGLLVRIQPEEPAHKANKISRLRGRFLTIRSSR